MPLRSQTVIFRVDASVLVGTGHVMRCLTLAHALRARGSVCRFIMRHLTGHLADRVLAQGFECTLLPVPRNGYAAIEGPPTHARWAEVPWKQDSEETKAAFAGATPDWLVLDHYAFDERWEEVTLPAETRLMVIDDLADRPHRADLLLDQNLGRTSRNYDGLVPEGCERLIGPRYALLRPEFARLRTKALPERAKRAEWGVRRLLVSMGGVDLPDATSAVLHALLSSPLPDDARITVVMGSGAPALEQVSTLAARLPWDADLQIDVSDMAALMADADLAIGAAGSTSWERCCTGLPSLVATIAANQAQAAAAMARAGIAICLGKIDEDGFASRLRSGVQFLSNPWRLRQMAKSASSIVDGQGTSRVVASLEG